MTDAVQIALIASAGPTLIGLLNAIHQLMVSQKINGMATNIQKVEMATNHMHDALISSTASASHAQGVQDEKLRSLSEGNVVVATKLNDPPK